VTIDFTFQFSVSANGDVRGTSAAIAGSPVFFQGAFTGSGVTFANTVRYMC
jgi:hypothetical protein